MLLCKMLFDSIINILLNGDGYMNYKMIVTDLDGTLLNDEKMISENDVWALNQLHNKGLKIVIATGRNYYMAKNLTEQIKNIDPIILANNGAIVRRSSTDELIEKNYLDANIFREIYKQGLKYNLHPIIHVDEYINGYDVIYEQEDIEKIYLGYIKKDDNRAKFEKSIFMDINNILAVCYLAELENLHAFNMEMSVINEGKYNLICNRNIGKRALLEFLHIDGCKWRALKRYANTIEIKPEEIIAFGDDNNDIELIMNVGMGIAMKNATEECREIATKISSFDNNNSGVYHELKELFF